MGESIIFDFDYEPHMNPREVKMKYCFLLLLEHTDIWKIHKVFHVVQ